MKEKDKSLFKYNGKTYKLIKQPKEGKSCKEFCSLHNFGCEKLCVKAYNELDNPDFGLIEAVFVEVDESENKETIMKDIEIDYKKLYEEEHKKYKDALGRARGHHSVASHYNNADEIQELEHIFPELKEKESEDERIRKELINFIKQEANSATLNANRLKFKSMLAWLEKHGEQKPIRPVWKYKKDHTPLLRDSFILNKYGCVAKSPSGALVSDVWVLDFGELAKLPKEEFERQGEQKPVDKVEPKFKVGDKINMINREEEDYTILTITSINMDEKCYICNQGSVIDFDEEREWYKIEQKPTDKVEPKFKVGDWIVYERNGNTYQIHSIDNHDSNYIIYACKPLLDNNDDLPCFSESMIHLWTIQDAKDGDVLVASDGSIFLLKGVIDGACKHYVALTIDNVLAFNEGLEHCWETSTSVHPATKEQRDILFQKMKGAGYEWDVEKKEVRKIEQKPSTSVTEFDTEVERFCKECFITDTDEKGKVFCIARHFSDWQKNRKNSAWSEEDEHCIELLLPIIDSSSLIPKNRKRCKEFLESLKERVQPKQELNEDVVNECVDLGLPSGTLWKSFNEDGYYTFDEAVNKFGNNLPSKEQWEELKDKCKWKWKGNGYDVTGPNGNTIFLPTNGYCLGTNVHSVGMYGSYWSSKHYDNDFAYYMGFGANFLDVNYYSRDTGRSVRLVK